jgi:hypothetical protein
LTIGVTRGEPDQEDARMAWQTSYLQDLGVVMIVYRGDVSGESLQEALTSSLALAGQHQTTRFLADCGGMGAGHSVVDLYELAKSLESIDLPSDAREAVVLPKDQTAADFVRFWETTCRNRGFNVRVFDAEPEATAWLTEPGSQAG